MKYSTHFKEVVIERTESGAIRILYIHQDTDGVTVFDTTPQAALKMAAALVEVVENGAEQKESS